MRHRPRSIPATRRLHVLVLFLAVALLAALAPAEPAQADDRVCRGTIGSRTIDDNVVVPFRATCVLDGTRVDGNVLVRPGGRLTVQHGARIDGNIQSERAGLTLVRANSVVLGDVQHQGGYRHTVVHTRVDGNIQVDDARRVVSVQRNVVGGDIQLFDNAGIAVYRNRVDGNLQCKGNAAPRRGGGNVVQGNKEDQCRRM